MFVIQPKTIGPNTEFTGFGPLVQCNNPVPPTDFYPVPTGPRIDLPIREKVDKTLKGRSKGDHREISSSGNARAIRI